MHEDYKSPPKQSGETADPGASGLDQYLWPQGVDSGAGGSVKAASATYDMTLDELHDTRMQLQGAIEKLSESYEVASEDLAASRERLYGAVKQEVVQPDGSGLGGVVGALSKLASEELISTFLPGMVSRLRDEGFQPQMLETSLEKRAGAFVNPEHPLVSAFQNMMKLAHETINLDGAMTELNQELGAVKAEIQKQAGPLTSGVRDAINAPGKVSPALRQRFPRT
jgi:prefoldin subunit 5